MFEKEVVVDGKNHLVGRLASYVAKELLSGQRVVVVRCEKLQKSGSLFRNKVKFQQYLNKRCSTNPRIMFVHYRAPSRVFWKTVRGMLPHKTARGAAALGRLKTFDGVPNPYDVKKRRVVPDALKQVRLKNSRKFCCLGDLCHDMGWRQQNLLDKLEEKRHARAKAYYDRKLTRTHAKTKALQNKECADIKHQLSHFGY